MPDPIRSFAWKLTKETQKWIKPTIKVDVNLRGKPQEKSNSTASGNN